MKYLILLSLLLSLYSCNGSGTDSDTNETAEVNDTATLNGYTYNTTTMEVSVTTPRDELIINAQVKKVIQEDITYSLTYENNQDRSNYARAFTLDVQAPTCTLTYDFTPLWDVAHCIKTKGSNNLSCHIYDWTQREDASNGWANRSYEMIFSLDTCELTSQAIDKLSPISIRNGFQTVNTDFKLMYRKPKTGYADSDWYKYETDFYEYHIYENGDYTYENRKIFDFFLQFNN